MLRPLFCVTWWWVSAWGQLGWAGDHAIVEGPLMGAVFHQESGHEHLLLAEDSTQLGDGELKSTREDGVQTDGPLETVQMRSNTNPVVSYDIPFAKIAERSPVLADYFRTYSPILEMDAFYLERDLSQINRYLVFGLPEGEKLTLGTQRFLKRLEEGQAKDFQVVTIQSARLLSSGKPAFTCPLSVGTLQQSPYFKERIWEADGTLRKVFMVPGSDSYCLHLFSYLLFWGPFANPFFVQEKISMRDKFGVDFVAQGLKPMIKEYKLQFPCRKLEQLTDILKNLEENKAPWKTPTTFWEPFLEATEYGEIEEHVSRTFSNKGPCSQVLTVTYHPSSVERDGRASVPLHTDRHAYVPADLRNPNACKAYLDEAYKVWKEKTLFARPGKSHLGHFVKHTESKSTKPKGTTIEERTSTYVGFYGEAGEGGGSRHSHKHVSAWM